MLQTAAVLTVLVTFVCSISAHTAGISDAEDFDAVVYLERAGYLDELGVGTSRYHAPDNVRTALREFQHFTGLEETGRLDKATVDMMQLPRCGLPDVTPPSKRLRTKRYRTFANRWDKHELTFKFLNYTPDLPKDVQRKAIISGFERWAAVTPLTFVEQTEGRADIEMLFAAGEHGCKFRFDWTGGTLAHAFWPGMSKAMGLPDDHFDGDVHFDEDEKWSLSIVDKDGTINLHEVATHEIGHALGLDHSGTTAAIMFPIHHNGQTGELGQDDIQGIQSLYGPPGGFPSTTPVPTTPNPNCKIHFDDVTRDSYGSIIAFDGYNVYLHRGDQGLGRRPDISLIYKGAPESPDAVVYDGHHFYFFKGSQYWRLTVGFAMVYSVDRDYPKQLPKDFENIDAAALINGSDIYIFQGNKFSRWDESLSQYSSDEPRVINSHFRNGPTSVDASFQATNGYLYLFQGNRYWRYKDPNVLDADYPKDMRPFWLGCGQKQGNTESLFTRPRK